MADKDDEIADDIIARQIMLFRFAAGERGRVLAILKRLEEELVELLFFSGRKLTDIGRADKARLLRQAQAVIAEYYGEAADVVGQSLGELGRVEAAATVASLGAAFQGAIVPALPTEAVFKRLVDDTLIMGAPSADWWKRQAADVAFRFKTEVAQGLAAAESNDQIIRRIRGRAAGYKVIEGKRVYEYVGGVMQIARHHAAAQVQTSVASVAATARRDTFLANPDIVKGIKQISTLDSHTTVICVAYSNAAWSLPGYVPIAPNKFPYNGGLPRHWNERSCEIPITKTFRELGLDIPEFEPTTRSAHGGPISAKISFDDFLKRKGTAFENDLLGPGRAQLWRDGKITLPQLLDQSGRPLSLKELRRRYG